MPPNQEQKIKRRSNIRLFDADYLMLVWLAERDGGGVQSALRRALRLLYKDTEVIRKHIKEKESSERDAETTALRADGAAGLPDPDGPTT